MAEYREASLTHAKEIYEAGMRQAQIPMSPYIQKCKSAANDVELQLWYFREENNQEFMDQLIDAKDFILAQVETPLEFDNPDEYEEYLFHHMPDPNLSDRYISDASWGFLIRAIHKFVCARFGQGDAEREGPPVRVDCVITDGKHTYAFKTADHWPYSAVSLHGSPAIDEINSSLWDWGEDDVQEVRPLDWETFEWTMTITAEMPNRTIEKTFGPSQELEPKYGILPEYVSDYVEELEDQIRKEVIKSWSDTCNS